jgi:ABC-type lipoprotein release transport system permease subunit
MDSLLLDLRYALRSLAKGKTFTLAAAVCLALGISANVVVFSAVNTLLLRPLPFTDPDRLVLVLVAVGLLIGIPAALALARVLRGALYGVSTADPATFTAIPALLALVALLASYIPARRATRIEATEALRVEG